MTSSWASVALGRGQSVIKESSIRTAGRISVYALDATKSVTSRTVTFTILAHRPVVVASIIATSVVTDITLRAPVCITGEALSIACLTVVIGNWVEPDITNSTRETIATTPTSCAICIILAAY